jgi:hypothetical protein
MTNSFKLVSFPTKSKVQIDGTTYVINSYIDKTGKTLKEKIKNLLVSEIHKGSSEQMAPIGQKDVV